MGAPVLRAYAPPHRDPVGGCIALTSPAVSMQIDLDLSPEGGDTFRMETPGYLLHHWDGSVLNSHICQIPCSPTFSGPHPFVGSVNPVEG